MSYKKIEAGKLLGALTSKMHSFIDLVFILDTKSLLAKRSSQSEAVTGFVILLHASKNRCAFLDIIDSQLKLVKTTFVQSVLKRLLIGKTQLVLINYNTDCVLQVIPDYFLHYFSIL